jgi:hypothetical protein
VQSRGGFFEMTTEPWSEFISRESQSKDEKELLIFLSAACEEVVNFGSTAFQRCINTYPSNGSDAHLAFCLFLRHAVELVDSISILIRERSIDPCKIILRSLLETALSIEWILNDALHIEDRAKAYIIFKAHRELSIINNIDESTNEGKKFHAELKESFSDGFEPPTDALQKFRDQKLAIIHSQHYANAEEEYQRIISESKRKRTPDRWYAMFPSTWADAPKTLKQLAKQVHHLDWYAYLYSFWSDHAHGDDVISGRLGGPNSIRPIRLIDNGKTLVFYTLFFGSKCIRQTSKGCDAKLVQEVDNWHDREIRPIMSDLGKSMRISTK